MENNLRSTIDSRYIIESVADVITMIVKILEKHRLGEDEIQEQIKEYIQANSDHMDYVETMEFIRDKISEALEPPPSSLDED